MDLQHLENGIGGGGGGGGSGGNGGGNVIANTQALSEIDFQRLAQTIATSIQKILQNGNYMDKYI